MTWLVGVPPFTSTLLGGLAVFRLQHRLHAVMAFAAGILVATALTDLIPEAVGLIGGTDAALTAGVAAVGSAPAGAGRNGSDLVDRPARRVGGRQHDGGHGRPRYRCTTPR